MKKSYYILFIIFFLISCKKFRKAKLIGNKWKIESVFVNGVNKTSDIDTLYISYYYFTEENSWGTYFVNIIIDTTNAHWEDSCILLNGTSFLSTKFYDRGDSALFYSTPCTYNKSITPVFIGEDDDWWQIIKSVKDDFWVQTNYGGSTYETHLKRIEE